MPKQENNINPLPTYQEIPADWAWENHIQYEDDPTWDVTWIGGGHQSRDGKFFEISNKFRYRGFIIDERIDYNKHGLIRDYKISHPDTEQTQRIDDNELGAITSTIDFWIEAYGEPAGWEV